MNIPEIIRKMPRGRTLYSLVEGVVIFRRIRQEFDDDYFSIDTDGFYYNPEGKMAGKHGECVLFPSETCRDWEHWAEALVHPGDIVKLKNGDIIRVSSTFFAFENIERFASKVEYESQHDKKRL